MQLSRTDATSNGRPNEPDATSDGSRDEPVVVEIEQFARSQRSVADLPATPTPAVIRDRYHAQLVAGRLRFEKHGPRNCEMISACFDRALALRRFAPLPPASEPIDAYFADPDCANLSPNVLFDEQWYLERNEDVRAAKASGQVYSGFVHFVLYGLHEGRSPNAMLDLARAERCAGEPVPAAAFDVASYVSTYPIVEKFLRCFPIIDEAAFYRLYGRDLGHAVREKPVSVQHRFEEFLLDQFDCEFYRAQYLNGRASDYEALQHYLTVGARDGNSPSKNFDELWYRSFYRDVGEAIAAGEILSGFQHYMMSGKVEQRLPCYKLSYALEARMAGITEPRLLQRASDIERRLQPPPHRFRAQQSRVWFCLPTLNPDISFGGYKAVFELIKATARTGRAIGLLITDDPIVGIDYFVYRERDRELVDVIKRSAYANRQSGVPVELSEDDLFVVYSVWDAYVIQPMLQETRAKKFLLLAQEYEPIFYECGSARALIEDAYRLDHVPLFNSRFLTNYFSKHEIGPFAPARTAEGGEHFVFEHVPTRLAMRPLQKQRPTRTLAFYARPEMHAARNLFELGYLALRNLCRDGVFDHRWRFVGLGALAEDHILPLGGGHQIEMVQKMPQEEYETFMSSIDIGLSLMLAPHPSVVPFEFAAAGAVVVTNVYENRSADDLQAICRNIVPCLPSLSGVEAALRAAVERAEDIETRERERLVLQERSWSSTFDAAVIERVFLSLTASRQA
ncbi:hypothetical protein [Methylobacterium nodulans]|uniref:Uncharacterized protein n=1 Tax=Methylobacterium nodulans (strain LMG 21967 / CNCM I-2342 / ORS 2060) TaxID=460265 RepID=B8IFG8_METNO|nr:hypothetical protein [Methylobacterium nodulans]ACL57703.1 hypothetical protein Mnod_2750 [Methylobacterium nodulans ORS 2060]